jgi:hypothetical protein
MTVTTETPRNDSGQFAPTESAYGREGLERAAGYKPLPEDKKNDGDDGLTVQEAADKVAKPAEAILTRSLDLPDNTTLTMEEAGERLAELRKADKKAEEIEADDKLTTEVDKARPKKEEPAAVESEPDDIESFKKLAMKNPKIRDALVQRAAEDEAVRTEFKQATEKALDFGRAAFLESFPEFQNLPVTQAAWQNALVATAQRDPARFQKMQAMLNRVGKLEQAQATVRAHEAAEFQTWSKSEDARYTDMMKGEKNLAAIEKNIPTMLKNMGADPKAILQLWKNDSKVLHSAEAQAILALASKADLAARAPKPTPPKPAARPVPPVVKPGASHPRASQAHTDARTLMGKLEQSGNFEDAVRAISAKRAAAKIGKR